MVLIIVCDRSRCKCREPLVSRAPGNKPAGRGARYRRQPERCALKPGGIAVINTLIEGTTYLDMFEPYHYYLFREAELELYFTDWEIVESMIDSFPAPGATVKRFATIIARRPAA